MIERPILVLGSGHLASELCRELGSTGHRIRYIPSQRFIDKEKTPKDESSSSFIREKLKCLGVGTSGFRALCIADSEDRMNINLLLATLRFNLTIPIVVSLLNDNIIWSDVHPLPPNVHVSNPSVASTPEFLAALAAPPTEAEKRSPRTNGRLRGNFYFRKFPFVVVLFLLCYAFGSVLFFRATENIGWFEGAYYVVTIVTGAGVGDTPTVNMEWYGILGRTTVVFLGYGFAVFGIGLFVAFMMRRHEDVTEFGRKRYRVRDHIIVAGLGKFGFHIATELLRRGETVVIIEEREDNPFLGALRSTWGRKARIFVGKANIRENLVDAGIGRAKGFIAAVNNDLVNIEIALTAFRARPNLRIVLRLFDSTLAESVQNDLNFQFTVNTSRIGARAILKHLTVRPRSGESIP